MQHRICAGAIVEDAAGLLQRCRHDRDAADGRPQHPGLRRMGFR